MKLLHLMYQFLLMPMIFLRYINPKSFIYIGLMVFIPSYTMAGGGGDSSCTAGAKECPIELVLDGDRADNQNPDKYYYFVVPKAQTVSSNIFDHNKTKSTTRCDRSGCHTYKIPYELSLKLYYQDSNGTCDTSTELAHIDDQTNSFSLSYDAMGGKAYCVLADGDSNDQYDINVTGNANLEAGISDASAKENAGPIKFTIALTKASSSDITINYTLTDGSAKNGINYTGSNGSVTIPAGSLSTEVSIDLIDTHMTTTKTFDITISSDDVDISEDDKTATGKIIGSGANDADENYEGPDICYESRENSGFCMFGSCMFYQETTRVRAMVDGLSDIDIKKALTRGIAFMNFFNGIGIDDESKTQQTGDDQAEERAFLDNTDFMPTSYYFASMFPKGYDYRLGNGADESDGGSMNKGDRTSYYDKALFKLGLFTQYTHIVTYIKDGVVHQEVLQPCNPDEYGALEEAPVLNECGVFLGALNSATQIKFDSSAWQTIHEQESLVTPSISGSTGYCSKLSATCPADGIGSNKMALPSFRDSKVSDNIDIPYSLVISDQHVGNLKTTTDSNTADPEDNRTIVFEAPYSGSYGKRVMFIKSITDHDTHANHYHYVFKTGDYWIGSWDISKNKNVTIETTGDVRFFIYDNFKVETLTSGEIRIGYHPDIDEESHCDDPHFYMYLYNNWDINAAGSAHIKNGYIYAKGTINIGGGGAFASYYTAITADGVVTVNTSGSGSYTAGNNGVCVDSENSTLFEACPGNITTYETGPFDAWDTFRDVDDRHISTKISNDNFEITIASINKDNNSTEAVSGKEAQYRLYDKITQKAISDWHTISGQSTKDQSYTDIDHAYKEVFVQFKFCQEKNRTPIVLATLQQCSDNPTDYEYNTTTQSSDGFAIRPDKFSIEFANTATNTLKSGRTYTFTLKALDKNNQPVADYNQTKNSIKDLNETKELLFKDGTVDTNDNLHGTLDFNATLDFNISDGISTDNDGNHDVVGIKFNDVSKVKIRIQDQSWSNIDSSDTPQNCDGGTINGTSVDGAFICGEQLVEFIPDHFRVSQVNIHNHRDGSFTYISSDLAMSAHIGVKIEAKNAQNITTRNFKSGDKYYENPLSISINAPSTDANSEAIGLSVVDKNISSKYLGFDNGSHTIAWNDTNSSQLLKLNYTRSISTPHNPFKIKGDTLEITASSDYNSELISGNAFGSNSEEITFLYARAKSTKDVYDDITEASTLTPIKVEVYCDKWPASTANCPGIDVTNQSTNNYKWFIASNHNTSTQDGNISLSIDSTNPSSGIASISPSKPNITTNGIDTTVSVSNNNATYPMTVDIALDTTSTDATNSWLIYDENPSSSQPFYQVKFVGSMDWAGYGNTGNVVDSNISHHKTKRLSW